MKNYLSYILLLIVSVFCGSCLDPYQMETNTFENALVIEATLTNELKHQTIKISRTYRFEENGPDFEAGADVTVTDDQGTVYQFEEGTGVYQSVAPFEPVAGRSYTLNVTTNDGQSYVSESVELTSISPLQSIEASVGTNNEGKRGVQITASSFDPTGSSQYYRYEYEETYKVISPEWKANDLVYDELTDSFLLTLRDPNSKICYSTDFSNTIIQTSTVEQSEDRVEDFEVRFISDQNPIISHRYSILIKQYVQSFASYAFYKALNDLSGSGNILSPNQPGFVQGNIASVTNPDEKVIGFFDVSSVSEQRIFFDYSELFPGEPLPPYFVDCTLREFDISVTVLPPGKSPKEQLIDEIEQGNLRYHSHEGSLYQMVVPPCGDCTSFSSNIIPSFWED